jgi:hypothetical protein
MTSMPGAVGKFTRILQPRKASEKTPRVFGPACVTLNATAASLSWVCVKTQRPGGKNYDWSWKKSYFAWNCCLVMNKLYTSAILQENRQCRQSHLRIWYTMGWWQSRCQMTRQLYLCALHAPAIHFISHISSQITPNYRHPKMISNPAPTKLCKIIFVTQLLCHRMRWEREWERERDNSGGGERGKNELQWRIQFGCVGH